MTSEPAPSERRPRERATLGITPSQTVGPFFAYALTPSDYAFSHLATADLTAGGGEGERVRLTGRVLDAEGAPVADAFVEIWQSDAQGRYSGAGAPGSNAAFTGFGRAETGPDGGFAFLTIKPASTPGPDGRSQAPHINVGLFARGVLRRLFTRLYFEDEGSNGGDPVLALVPEDRRATLIARRTDDGEPAAYALDIRLAGEGETVFFEA